MTIAYKSNSRLGRRRSQRVALSMPVVVWEPDSDRRDPIEKTHTLSVSRHGGLMTLRVDVACGQSLMVTNAYSRVSLECRVVYVAPDKQEARVVGFEFLEPATNFWNITFPISA
ncbi:MAG TPA: PilZ domain-containing protein [Candidatus Solibacter sp.]|nr:PilZ domain-containing protein [Candidatus Solibacter sp.]